MCCNNKKCIHFLLLLVGIDGLWVYLLCQYGLDLPPTRSCGRGNHVGKQCPHWSQGLLWSQVPGGEKTLVIVKQCCYYYTTISYIHVPMWCGRTSGICIRYILPSCSVLFLRFFVCKWCQLSRYPWIPIDLSSIWTSSGDCSPCWSRVVITRMPQLSSLPVSLVWSVRKRGSECVCGRQFESHNYVLFL